MLVSPWFRLLFYGALGFSYEIMFTAIWDFVASNFSNFKFTGYSSIWSFFIYGTCSYCGEHVYLQTRNRLPTFVRGLVYIQMAYAWEFISGLLLNQFSARTWDYTHYEYDVMGLIALEYAPLWFCSGLLQEHFYEYLLSLSPHQSVESLERKQLEMTNANHVKMNWRSRRKYDLSKVQGEGSLASLYLIGREVSSASFVLTSPENLSGERDSSFGGWARAGGWQKTNTSNNWRNGHAKLKSCNLVPKAFSLRKGERREKSYLVSPLYWPLFWEWNSI